MSLCYIHTLYVQLTKTERRISELSTLLLAQPPLHPPTTPKYGVAANILTIRVQDDVKTATYGDTNGKHLITNVILFYVKVYSAVCQITSLWTYALHLLVNILQCCVVLYSVSRTGVSWVKSYYLDL